MSGYADLEIGLTRWEADRYRVDLRFSWPDGDIDLRPSGGSPALARFDFAQLRALELDPSTYGISLGQALFADPDLTRSLALARSNARTSDAVLRLRLFINPNAAELHGLHWETLCDPADRASLVANERILFSRYLSSQDWQRVKLRPRSDLRALIFIANPSNLAQYSLAPVDVSGELTRIQAALGVIPLTTLPASGTASLTGLVDKLREDVDILYLVCHGTFKDGKPWLYLEDENGQVTVLDGEKLVERISELVHPPRLVVLASCQSAAAQSDATGALLALGPRLAQAGVSAVVAMQGNITMQTNAAFMPAFFKEMHRDGQIDRAMAVARGSVRDRTDSWMPVLFTRLKSGRIWYTPGFGSDEQNPEEWPKWPTLIRSILDGRCTPILGSGLVEHLLGSSRDIARGWAEKYAFPMSEEARDDLPQVAQYIAVKQDDGFVRSELGKGARREILRRFGSQLPQGIDPAKLSLDDLITCVGAQLRTSDPDEPHAVLASLPFPLYITTNPDGLLEAALTASGKTPVVALCPWYDNAEQKYNKPYKGEYSPQSPLVYHLFGRLNDPQSLVLTEDDYFDYLIGVTRKRKLVPPVVNYGLSTQALLFLGFRLDEWNFRVLYRSVMNIEGRKLLGRNSITHVAVQIDLDEDQAVRPDKARQYLEKYFGNADISIYWGSAEDFIRELHQRVRVEQQAA